VTLIWETNFVWIVFTVSGFLGKFVELFLRHINYFIVIKTIALIDLAPWSEQGLFAFHLRYFFHLNTKFKLYEIRLKGNRRLAITILLFWVLINHPWSFKVIILRLSGNGLTQRVHLGRRRTLRDNTSSAVLAISCIAHYNLAGV
jgi:hypothetical protein